MTRDAERTQIVAIGDAKKAPGFDAAIAKPFEREALVALVEKAAREVEA